MPGADEDRALPPAVSQARGWLAEPLDVAPLPGGGDPLNGELWTEDELPPVPTKPVDAATAPPAAKPAAVATPATTAKATPAAPPVPAGPPVLAPPEPAIGRLPPEIVQHIVRKNIGRFRGCYASGLLRNPKLQGRVTTRFVIHHDGLVSEATQAGSTLSDAEVAQCIVEAFRHLTFPRPEGGVVIVTYPLRLTPRIAG